MNIPDETKDLLKRIDTLVLYQPFLAKINELLNILAAKGMYYVATCGYRSYKEQNALYAIGRTVDREGNPLTPETEGHYVTKAEAGKSPHQFCCAIDFVRHKGTTWNGKLDPDYTKAAMKPLADEAKKLGLEAGYFWKFTDTPHIQLPVKAKGLSWKMLDAAYQKDGLEGVYKLLDEKGPW
jgi:hypothetical protein